MGVGEKDKITPDMIEWVVSDEKVASRWKDIAERLGLNNYVTSIDRNYSYRRKKFDRQKLKELFDVWRRASPITYTRTKLMDTLGKEGLCDMYSWLQLMETSSMDRKSEIQRILDSNLGTPRSVKSLSPQPLPFSSHHHHHLSSSSVSSNNSSLLLRPPPSFSAPPAANPSSPYSWYFGPRDPSPSSRPYQNGHGHQNGPQNGHQNGHQNGGGDGASSSAYSFVSTASSAGPGILKKKESTSLSSAYSDYAHLGNGHSKSNGGGTTVDYAATSRESTPDSLSRPISRISIDGHSTPAPPSSATGTIKSTKSIRFADDQDLVRELDEAKNTAVEVVVHRSVNGTSAAVNGTSAAVNGTSAAVNGTSNGTYNGTVDGITTAVNGTRPKVRMGSGVGRATPPHQDKSVERYFDNLISMIEDAAEGL